MTERYAQAGIYLFELIEAALTKTQPKEKPEGVSWEFLYRLAEEGAVLGVSFYGVERLPAPPPEKWYQLWRRGRDLAVYRQIRFEAEREEIISALDERGISCIPLKGVWLAGYYPEPGMREMLDNDILYGFVEPGADGAFKISGSSREEQNASIKRAREILHTVMTDRGYQKEEPGAIYHEEYLKKPMFDFEMHHRLGSPGIAYHYYENSWRFAVRSKEDTNRLKMREEDAYIYLMAHEYGHFTHGDSKIRFLADLYVFLKQEGPRLRWDYIRRELQYLEILEFEKRMRSLLSALTSPEKNLTGSQKEILYLLLEKKNSAENVENRSVEGRMVLLGPGKGRLQYLWSRICIPKAECRAFYPFVYRHPFLMPFLILYRLAKGLICKRKKIAAEIRSLWSLKKRGKER